jgi:phosphoribosylformimino-5-aminoimidazole carboxamide ribotide isomerase
VKIIPAIDLRKGRCVRLLRGERGTEIPYGEDPVAMAKHWEEEGASFLHVVDLDAAFGEPAQEKLVAAIATAVAVPVQVGGGVRSMAAFERLREAGVARVVFGTVAIEDPEVVEHALARDASKVTVGVDVKCGEAAVRGWTESGGLDPLELGRKWASAGCRHFVYTEVSRDGVMSGVDREATERFATATGGGVFASGGIGSIEHLEELLPSASLGIEGVIVGKALYEGRFTLGEALAVMAGAPKARKALEDLEES